MEIIMKKNKKCLDDYILNIKELSKNVYDQLTNGTIVNITTEDDYLHKQIFEKKVKNFKQQVEEQTNLTKEVQDFIENIKAHI